MQFIDVSSCFFIGLMIDLDCCLAAGPASASGTAIGMATNTQHTTCLTSPSLSLVAHLRLRDIPLLDGAKECIEMGISSTLYPQVISQSINLLIY